MIVEPFEPISEPRVCGWPHHGFLAEKQPAGGGYNSYSLFINGEEIPVPADFTAMPSETRNSFKIRHPDAEPIDLTPEEIHTEALEHRSWKDFATISGYQSIFYGAQLGYRAWIAVLSDNRAWRVALDTAYNPAIGQMEWIMAFSRYAYGPVYRPGQDIGYRSFSIRIYDDATVPIYFSSYAATNNIGHTLVDIGAHGRYAIMRFTELFPIRVPNAADLASMGINLDTVSGALNILWCPIIDNVYENESSNINFYATNPNSFMGGGANYSVPKSQSVKTPMYSYRFALTADSVSRLSSLAASETGVTRVSRPDDPGIYVDYATYDIPPITIEWDVTLERKAHVLNDGDEGFVIYKSRAKVRSTISPSGVLGIKGWANGSSPDIVGCPPPASPTASGTITVKSVIEYGSNRWEKSSSLTIDMGAYYTLRINTGDAWYAMPPLNSDADSLRAVFQAFFVCPESTSSAVFDFGTAYTAMAPSVAGSEFSAPVMHVRSRAGVEHPGYCPVLSEIPPGTYYKGEFVSSWLPSSSVVWAYDYSTGDIISLPRPATADSEGYLYVTYV